MANPDGAGQGDAPCFRLLPVSAMGIVANRAKTAKLASVRETLRPSTFLKCNNNLP